ncbi:MAG TPA: ferritin-like protein [Thermoanaerobaculia bacterium]|jgi:hypothetical protein
MLYVQRQQLDSLDDLKEALKNAIQLEFSTIPPYLTALYSIVPGKNDAIAAILRSIVFQEMLHFGLVCNILNGVGGCPDIPAVVPVYPGPLPMGIGDAPGKQFIVPLKKLSVDTVRDVFMVIEEPESPIHFPVDKVVLEAVPEYHTIGEFYEAVSRLIADLGEKVFTGKKERQVTGYVGPDELFAVTNVASAQRAIEIIVRQGEGTPTSPVGGPDGLAHYYRFEEIAKGKTLHPNPDVPEKYSFGNPPIPLDETVDVYPMADNPPTVPLDPQSQLGRMSQRCDETFSALVDGLQETFDGTPDHLGAAIGLMYSLRVQAQSLMAEALPDGNGNAGPRFLYNRATAAG